MSEVAGFRRGLLWHRDFRLLWFGQTVSTLGSSVTSLAVPLIATVTLGSGTFVVGALTAAAWVPWLLIGLPAGVWVDRLARRTVMLVCNLASALVLVTVPLVAWFGTLTVGQLLAVALAAGFVRVFFTITYRSYLPCLVDQRDLVEGNAKMFGSESAAQVAGPGVAGLLARAFGPVSGLLVDAVSFLVAFVCLWRIRTRETVDTAGAAVRNLRAEMAMGLRFVRDDPYLRVFTCYGALVNLMLTGASSVEVVFLVRVVGADPAAVGVLLALVGLGGVGGAALAGRVAGRWGTARGVLWCQLCTGPFAVLVPLTTAGAGLAYYAAGKVVVVAGVATINVIFGSFRQSYCPSAVLGRIVATVSVLNFGAIPIGALAAGALGAVLGPRTTLWLIAGGFVLVGGVLAVGPVRRDRDLPTRPGPL